MRPLDSIISRLVATVHPYLRFFIITSFDRTDDEHDHSWQVVGSRKYLILEGQDLARRTPLNVKSTFFIEQIDV
jgi:hypothetical protein